MPCTEISNDGAEAPPAPSGAGAILVHVMTVPESLGFLAGQASYVRGAGFVVHAIASPGPYLQEFGEREQVSVRALPMTRRITPLRDLASAWCLWRLLRTIRPTIVHAHTPKGGLLGMLAATLAGVPVRIYHVRGLPFVTATGARRALLRATERVSCGLAHRVLSVSHSMRRIAIEEGLCGPDKIKVLAGGSGNGVDAIGRFVPLGERVRVESRARFGIPPDATVVGFVGRVEPEKGITELASAWGLLRERNPKLHLLLVGRVEGERPLPPGVLASLRADPRVHLAGVASNTPPLYAAMDVVALPTYREGFPNVPLEAAAMALPVVATAVPGCVDAVEDGVTGKLVPPRDATALADALQTYVLDGDLRARHGEAGRRRVLAHFAQRTIWEAVAEEYRALLARTAAEGGPVEHLAGR